MVEVCSYGVTDPMNAVSACQMPFHHYCRKSHRSLPTEIARSRIAAAIGLPTPVIRKKEVETVGISGEGVEQHSGKKYNAHAYISGILLKLLINFGMQNLKPEISYRVQIKLKKSPNLGSIPITIV